MREILEKYGEPVDPSWKLVISEPVTFDEEGNEIFSKASTKLLALTRQYGDNKSGVTNTESSQDNHGFLLRYRYGNRPSSKSRPFCVEMTGLASGGLVYTRENIIRMGDAGINGEWAQRGQNSYSIWLYKGGGGCRHVWFRQIFSAETGKETGRDAARRRGYVQPTNPAKVPTPPATMPNAAFINRDGGPWKI